MKNLTISITLIISVFMSSMLCAQSTTATESYNPNKSIAAINYVDFIKTTTAVDDLNSNKITTYDKLFDAHGKMAMQQLRECYTQSLNTYWANKNGFEGKLVLGVQIDEQGKVIKQILESSKSIRIDQEVMKAIKDCDQIETGTGIYIGVKNIRIPISIVSKY